MLRRSRDFGRLWDDCLVLLDPKSSVNGQASRRQGQTDCVISAEQPKAGQTVGGGGQESCKDRLTRHEKTGGHHP